MMYRHVLILCFLGKTVLSVPTIEIIRNISSPNCGNFTSLEKNVQSVTFKITGDWGNSVLSRSNTPELRYSDGTVICPLVSGQDACTDKYYFPYDYTCTCENKTGGVYHLNFTSIVDFPTASYSIFMIWVNGQQEAKSDFFVVKEVKREPCPCRIDWGCMTVNLVLVVATVIDMVMLDCLFCCCKHLLQHLHGCVWGILFLGLLILPNAIQIGLIKCYAGFDNCQVDGEKALIGVAVPTAIVGLGHFVILCILLASKNAKSASVDVSNEQGA